MAVPTLPDPAPLYQKTDHWFQRATAALLGEVPCRLGCTSCCIGPFPITLLDVHTDPDHHRSVLTLAGQADELGAAVLALAQTAVRRIDLSGHQGVHPRLGALLRDRAELPPMTMPISRRPLRTAEAARLNPEAWT